MASQGSKEGTGNFRPCSVQESEAIYRASGRTSPEYKISDDMMVFVCKGFVVDRVDGLGEVTYDD
jgi:hypothetical protein